MHMVAHQHVRMQPAAKTHQRLLQALQVALPIRVIQETWQPIVAPLHDMLRNPREVEAGKSGHATSISTSPERHHRRKPQRLSAHRPPRRQKLSLAPLFASSEIVPGTFVLGRARDPLVTPHPLYLALGSDPTERADAYRRWLDAGIAPDDLQHLRAYARQERALGDERFQRMVETTLGRPATCRPRGRPRQAGERAGA